MNIKKSVVIISGTRPDAIKQSPIILRFKKNSNFSTHFIASGQHLELLQDVFDIFGIHPDKNFKIMEKNQSLTSTTAKLLPLAKRALDDIKPNIVIVQGDTLTSFIFGLAAFSNKIPVAHVEAGLRSHDFYNPFPEEGYRKMISVLTTYHFPPTALAKQNLIREGIHDKNIYVTGNTIVDSLYWIKKNRKPKESITIPSKKYILLTMHRRENYGLPMINVFNSVKNIVNKNPDVSVIYPVHPSPHVKKAAQNILGGVERVNLINPVDYTTMINLLENAHFIITDSGGIQEEALSIGTRALVTRKVTERSEGIKSGVLKVVGTNSTVIEKESNKMLSDSKKEYKIKSPFGDGKAAMRIESYIEKVFGFRNKLLKEFTFNN